jgi:hypothetical protein
MVRSPMRSKRRSFDSLRSLGMTSASWGCAGAPAATGKQQVLRLASLAQDDIFFEGCVPYYFWQLVVLHMSC